MASWPLELRHHEAEDSDDKTVKLTPGSHLTAPGGKQRKRTTKINPSVKDNCSGMQFSHLYCVEVNNGIPCKGETTTTQAAKPKPTKTSKPSPT
ncbi:hypothetical protein FOCG_17519 [Fusarium oxysporum f. sp. radicis-lycopersici 26381]|nr:hypothetical protein FOWG_16452 [Fusarium oxysporum f. sp. lycopersici MN25]EXL39920.1 hypothetical protein FOCG_17519 [Fusarium oxysporum f. sp. radicis-lycopersici 26381]